MTSYIKRLPAVFQTVTEKKFFDATFDQVFSKKDSDLLAGYLGRRNPGSYNPITDFYIPEPSKNRTWWQLEATAYARNADTTKSNVFFYDDLLETIEYYGGNTLNQDRLFESEYYSFGPPLDYDMFINYQNYYWVEQGLAAITIIGVMATDIIGQTTYTTPPSATPPNFTLSSGMSIILASDPAYATTHTVENLGGCAGLALVERFADFTSGTVFEFLPWDSSIELSTGRIINNIQWDATTWEVQSQPGNQDYITIERGSLDRNAWSRTNKWFHINTINATIVATGTPFPSNASRALRPIIQFNADLVLYKSGTQFRDNIAYGFKSDKFGAPLLLSNFQGQQANTLNTTYGITLHSGDLVSFFDDVSVNTLIYSVQIQLDDSVNFVQSGAVVVDGDIVFATEDAPYDGAQRGQTWYFSNGAWNEAFNDKITTNQPPLFQLYDHNGVELDNSITYPDSTFNGNKIFSYEINTEAGAIADPVLKFPIVYTSLGQASDILFQNNLITNRYTYTDALTDIDGYYYYKTATSPILHNGWNLYDICNCDDIVPPPPCNCVEVSKQRVIDKFVVGYGSEFKFKLSVEPFGYPTSPDLIVTVNNLEVHNSTEQTDGYSFVTINNRIYVDLTTYLTNLLLVTQAQPPVVEVQTYTHGLLDPTEKGYFEIPQQLEANPTQLEVGTISASNLIQHFSSIISNQIGFTGIAFGGPTNYRDSRKNGSIGSYILQNVAPALKSMLVASEDELDFITGVRFSQDEYTKFKSKYLTVAQTLINQGFSPLQYHNNTILVTSWVSEILKIINISKEFSNAFAYSFMAASGTPFAIQAVTIAGNSSITLNDYVDLSDPRNVLYIYNTTDPTNVNLLVVGRDYTITSANLAIDIQMNIGASPANLAFYLYKNPLPVYIPSTPTKLGMYPTYIPVITLDTSYAEQQGNDQYGNPVAPYPTVIIGHDGSKTIAYGDYRDRLLLEMEKRIYNFMQARYQYEYKVPLRVESIKSGFFRETRYSRDEYLEITESYLNKWSAKFRANYRVNDWASASQITTVQQLWKLYNYRDAVTTLSAQTNLPGNWKGIFQYYYDTYYVDTQPWNMLGFSEQPSWWQFEYGAPLTNTEGQDVWGSTASGNNNMYADLEAGIIRQGPSAVFDPITLLPQPQTMWARPGLSAVIPVDTSGEIIPVITLFGLAYSGNPYEPFDHFDADWVYGDGGPVEQAWMSTSAYAFSVQEFLYLMRPGPYGELMWDTLGTEISPGQIDVPGIEGPVLSNTNWQYVQNDAFTNDDQFFAWMRPKNADQVVHAEIVDGVTEVRFGYQSWISDRLLFLGKNIADTFGQKIRTLDVNLANKLAGFTNKDTTTTYIESVTPGASTNTLLIPSTNFDVLLHTSPSVDTYSYSGIIVRALADGTFVVYGYDLLNAEFLVLGRNNEKSIDISVGGTPAEFRYYASGETYNQGDIVRYNGVYYESLATQEVQKFTPTSWQKLNALPTVGGVSVSYKPFANETITKVPYGTILKTPQQVFDLMIGWGDYLVSQGWKFEDVNQDTNILNDWLSSAKQFLFWLNTQWAPDASIQLSPLANSATLIVRRGYPNDVESLSNGVYSILDKYGVAIPPNGTTTDRDGPSITVAPADLSSGGIYFLQVNASETEHVLIFDNTTNFNDTIYAPLLRARQQRLRFNGFRSNGWYGKMEAAGYLIIENELVPNFDTIVESMRYFYDSNITIDNPSLEDLGRHLIGYESKSYLDNLQVSNDVQYLFYQGAIRQKGTEQAFDKLFRSKLGSFGNTIEQVSTEFKLVPEQNTGEVLVARLNFVPSPIGFVREIKILNAENTYTTIPKVVVAPPDANPLDPNLTDDLRTARAYIVLDSTGRISRVDITDPGYGYLSAPYIEIDSGLQAHNLDKLYSVFQGEIIKDTELDNIINIDIDQVDKWVVRPSDPTVSLVFPTTNQIDYPVPNAGYVNFNDVTLSSFDVDQTTLSWGSKSFNPVQNDTIWIAKTFTEDWDVYKLIDITTASDFDVIEDAAGNLLLRTDPSYLITPQFTNGTHETDFGNMIVLQVIEAQADVLIDGNLPSVTATATATTPFTATATANLIGGAVSGFSSLIGGSGYTFTPIVDIEAPISGTLAIATAVVENGIVTDIIVSSPGSGYVSPPVITIESPTGNGTVYTIDIVNGGSGYTAAPIVTITGNGTGATATAFVTDGVVTAINVNQSGVGYSAATISIAPPPSGAGVITDIVITKTGANYDVPPAATLTTNLGVFQTTILGGQVTGVNIPTIIGVVTSASVIINPPLVINGDDNFTIGFTFNSIETTSDSTHNYYDLVDLDGNPIAATSIPEFASFTKLMLFKSMRFLTAPTVGAPSYVTIGDKIWVDNIDQVPPRWAVYDIVTPSASYPAGHKPYRVQAPLVDIKLFESASVFNDKGTEIAQLPVFDPFKNILPGPARQNITYMSLQDPARYNVTGEVRLFSENITFGERQVGQLWWDLSNTRFVYYEQPATEDEIRNQNFVQNLEYRRDHWGQLFPGATVDIYEWVKSPVPPTEYTGTGIPRDITSYVQLTTSNRFTNATEVNYYFWVLGATDKPNIENRTLAAINVARLLQSPKSQGFAFFAPIQQTSTNNSYMFYNVQEILAYQGDNIQVQYRIAERNDQKHTQWGFFREGDTGSLVTDQFWNKMVDSLCGYTKVLPVSAEFANSIIIADSLPWDIYGWDISPYDDATSSSTAQYGEILPVPDPMLSEGEKYGVLYRPRQGMFVNLFSARKIFVQAANELLKHIAVRDDNPTWNADVATDDYWTYTNWYEIGYEDVLPTIVYPTLIAANTALTAGTLKLGTILEVTAGTTDGRYVLYAVIQLNPNVPTLSLQEVGIENSAIKLLDTIYTVINKYGLSTELRELLNSFRTEVMVDAHIVDQNELFFSMLNYVVSEQKNPDWVFKSSYIYIKEDNIPLTQDQLYIPDQINNIIDYITDVKPYHTQIRDYTSTYVTSDIAAGTASDSIKWAMTLQFGPSYAGTSISVPINTLDSMYGWDFNQGIYSEPWDSFAWDYAQTIQNVINQSVSRNPTTTTFIPAPGDPWPDEYTVPLTFFDVSKVGLSQLFPYTFDFNSLNIDNPQTFVTPYNIVAVQVGNTLLYYGYDYYVEDNNDTTYTIYFYNDPGNSPVPVAFVWFDGGDLNSITNEIPREEVYNGVAKDDMVVNVDTRLPVNIVNGNIEPYVGWGDVWDSIDASTTLGDILVAAGAPTTLIDGNLEILISWDAPYDLLITDVTISSKENVNISEDPTFTRNADAYAGTLAVDLPAPTAETYNLDVITVFVDPLSHVDTNILPHFIDRPGVIWINGERIEYRDKQPTVANTWELKLVRRGTNGTGVSAHAAGAKVFVAAGNDIPTISGNDVNTDIWNILSLPAQPSNQIWNALLTYSIGNIVSYLGIDYIATAEVLPGAAVPPVNASWSVVVSGTTFTSASNVPAGGLWYSQTPEAEFLRQQQGTGIP